MYQEGKNEKGRFSDSTGPMEVFAHFLCFGAENNVAQCTRKKKMRMEDFLTVCKQSMQTHILTYSRLT